MSSEIAPERTQTTAPTIGDARGATGLRARSDPPHTFFQSWDDVEACKNEYLQKPPYILIVAAAPMSYPRVTHGCRRCTWR
jgi:hypothetical protein